MKLHIMTPAALAAQFHTLKLLLLLISIPLYLNHLKGWSRSNAVRETRSHKLNLELLQLTYIALH